MPGLKPYATSPISHPVHTPGLTQLRGVPGRVPAPHHSVPGIVQPLFTRWCRMPGSPLCPAASLLPGPRCLSRPLAGLPLALKDGQGSLQLRSRGVDEGALGELTSLSARKAAVSSLAHPLPATHLQSPVPIPAGMEQSSSLDILAQEAPGIPRDAGDGPDQVAGGGVQVQGRGASPEPTPRAQHPQQCPPEPPSCLAQPDKALPGSLPWWAHRGSNSAAAERKRGPAEPVLRHQEWSWEESRKQAGQSPGLVAKSTMS